MMPEACERLPGDAIVLHVEGDLFLEDIDGRLHLMDGSMDWTIGSHPRDPTTYLSEGDDVRVTIRNAFDETEIRRVAAHGGTTTSISGNEYDAGRLMRLLALAVRLGPDTDISRLEDAMAVEALRAAGATGPDAAVRPEDIGFRSIQESRGRPGKPSERVMRTDDGRVYLASGSRRERARRRGFMTGLRIAPLRRILPWRCRGIVVQGFLPLERM